MKGRGAPRVPPHADAHQRMNFLCHAAHQVVRTNPDLSRQYIRHMVLVARKLVIRMCDPHFTRRNQRGKRKMRDVLLKRKKE